MKSYRSINILNQCQLLKQAQERNHCQWLSIIDYWTVVFVNIFYYISKVKFCSGIYKNRSSFKKTYASWIQSSFDNTISDCKMIGYRSLAEASMNGTLPLNFEAQHPVGAEKSLTLKIHVVISCYIVPEKRGKKLCLEEFFLFVPYMFCGNIQCKW